jgi:transposase-like protein
MYRIVSGITSLQQHIETLHSTPEVYRPVKCPHCGRAGLWRHGYYSRKSNRNSPSEKSACLIEISRYLCPACCHTCSRLPSCVPPRRWYSWLFQQQILQCLLEIDSLHRCAELFDLCRRTIRRWWSWLHSRTGEFEFLLKSRFPEWGRATDSNSFWRGCLDEMPLSEVMASLDRDGVNIP